jgi:hypothetical protein
MFLGGVVESGPSHLGSFGQTCAMKGHSADRVVILCCDGQKDRQRVRVLVEEDDLERTVEMRITSASAWGEVSAWALVRNAEVGFDRHASAQGRVRTLVGVSDQRKAEASFEVSSRASSAGGRDLPSVS